MKSEGADAIIFTTGICFAALAAFCGGLELGLAIFLLMIFVLIVKRLAE